MQRAVRGGLLGTAVLAAVGAQAQSVQMSAGIGLSETYTDNRQLSAGGDKQGELITDISPYLHIARFGGAVQGMLDYSPHALIQRQDSGGNTVAHQLAARLSAIGWDNHFVFDANASIAQQAVSAWGVQPGNGRTTDENRSQVATLSLAPTLRGTLAGVVDVQAGLSWDGQRSGDTNLGDSNGSGAFLSLGGRRGFVGWGLDLSRRSSDFQAGQKTTQDSGVFSLMLVPDVDWQFTGRLGREAGDQYTFGRTWTRTWGWGLDWTPSPRTRLSYQSDDHQYGDSHTFTFSHRMARSIIVFSDTRGVSGGAWGRQADRPATVYDLWYAQAASLYPDPAQRDAYVRLLLAAFGLDPSTQIGAGFLASGLTLQRSQILSFSVEGLRNTITLSAYRNDTRPLDDSPALEGDLADVSRVRQQGASAVWSHRLAANASLAAALYWMRTPAQGLHEDSSDTSASLGLQATLGVRTTGSVTLRHTQHDGEPRRYQETALTASVSIKF